MGAVFCIDIKSVYLKIAEIQLCCKQYGYYRGKLLSFSPFKN